ncbi:MAG TPA: multicopper oxidase domain-containing protein [Acidimicrobiales bacterium]|nr:multicopper oxidase domain-containing protein [Acidimicrobiales bacterium]
MRAQSTTSSDGRRRVGQRHHVRFGTIAITSTAGTYSAALWLQELHRAQGVGTRPGLSFFHQWLADGMAAFPWVLLGATAGAVLAAAVGTARSNHGRGFVAAMVAAGAGAGIAATSGATNALTALPILLAVALVATGREPRPITRTQLTASAVAGLLVASLLAVPGVSAGTGSTASIPIATDPGNPCALDANVKHFDVLARDVDIPLNNFGDHDPLGKMYVLAEDNAAVDVQLALQKPGPGGAHVTPGLKDDVIQPLVIRANEGDCVEIAYTNTIKGTSYGLHIDGLQFEAGSAGSAIGNNPASDSRAGGTQTYRYYVPRDETLEGAHYLHPGPAFRQAVDHGLFGVLVVEPPGSKYFDPVRNADEQAAHQQEPTREQRSGAQAMIVPCDGSPFNLSEVPLSDTDIEWCNHYGTEHPSAPTTAGAFAPQTPVPFRENVTILHEVGDESYQIPNRVTGQSLPSVDPNTEAYRPGARAINYRSEPFFNRLDPQKGKLESLSYDSYAFGDPATPVDQAYVSDATKIRLVHGGAEMMHVYHLHSGGLHWSPNPLADLGFDYGNTAPDKFPSDQRSVILDSQAMGPGETFNVELNHGAGGAQGAVGDFVFHCHIPEHYFAGMWGIRRVFDTLQPDLWELPVDFTGTSRLGTSTTRATLNPDGTFPDSSLINPPSGVPPAVDSAEWLGLFARNADQGYMLPDGTQLTPANIDAWVRALLPPATQGTGNDQPGRDPGAPPPRGDRDASSMDWVIQKDDPSGFPLYLGEPEWTKAWPDLPASEPFGDVDGHLGAFRIDAFSQDQFDPNRFVTFQGVSRPRILFNPCASCSQVGMLTYPVLRPHIEQRPPFSPNGHSGAPTLAPTSTRLVRSPDGTDWIPDHPSAPNPPDTPPRPWAFRDDAICPYNSVFQHHVNDADPTSPFNTSVDNTRRFNVVTIETPIRVTKTGVDEAGALLALARDPNNPAADDKTGIYLANGQDPLDPTNIVDANAAANNPNPPTPLAIRGNVGDCVALTLTSEEKDENAFNGYVMANLHIHHVQFDITGSDGAVVGFNYETSIRPYRLNDHPLLAAVKPGDTMLSVGPSKFDETRLIDGMYVAVGEGTNDIEVHQVRHVTTTPTGLSIELATPLTNAHTTGDWAGTEFVQARWYLDQPLDNVFFHDHTDGIHAWLHGLVGQIVVEPKGATYHDPATGREIRSGTIADIHVADPRDPTQAPPDIDKPSLPCAAVEHCRRITRLAPGLVDGSFREFAMWEIDGNPVSDSTINLRAEPLSDRSGGASTLFSSATDSGDPFTPIPKAYPGDPFVVRSINVSPNVDTLVLDGTRAYIDSRLTSGYEDRRTDPSDPDPSSRNDGNERDVLATPVDALTMGPSERFTLVLDGGAGGRVTDAHGAPPDRAMAQAGDYLYMNGLDRRVRQGAWGVIRVLPKVDTNVLEPLPGRLGPVSPGDNVSAAEPTLTDGQVVGRPAGAPDGPAAVCPVGSAQKTFRVSAVDKPTAGTDAAFVLTAPSGKALPPSPLEPLTLHVAEGDCVHVVFKNERVSEQATFHLAKLQHLLASSGINLGNNPGDQSVAPGSTRDYWYYADSEKIGTAIISDFGGAGQSTGFGKLQHGAPELSGVSGLYGAVIVSPPGAAFSPSDVGTAVDVTVPERADQEYREPSGEANRLPAISYRDFTVFFSDTDKQLGNDFMPYPTEVSGAALINYQTAAGRGDDANSFSSLVHGDPATPVLRTIEGDPMVFHVVGDPGNDQVHLFNLGGMAWENDHYLRSRAEPEFLGGEPFSSAISTRAFGAWAAFDAWVLTSPGEAGRSEAPKAGDYFMGDIRRPFTEAGMWGLVRVSPSPCVDACPPPLPIAPPPPVVGASAVPVVASSPVPAGVPAPGARTAPGTGRSLRS